MGDFLNFDISLIISLIALILSIYSLWIARKDRKLKHIQLEDYQRAEPLFNIDFREYELFQGHVLPNSCKLLFERINTFDLSFKDQHLNSQFKQLLADLHHLAFEHPHKQDRYTIIENGKRLSVSNPEFDTIYQKDGKDWFNRWDKFLREIKIKTAGKEG